MSARCRFVWLVRSISTDYSSQLKVGLTIYRQPTDTSKQPIRSRYLRHMTGYQPIRDHWACAIYRLEWLVLPRLSLFVRNSSHYWNLDILKPPTYLFPFLVEFDGAGRSTGWSLPATCWRSTPVSRIRWWYILCCTVFPPGRKAGVEGRATTCNIEGEINGCLSKPLQSPIGCISVSTNKKRYLRLHIHEQEPTRPGNTGPGPVVPDWQITSHVT